MYFLFIQNFDDLNDLYNLIGKRILIDIIIYVFEFERNFN